jgi:transposase-like protein
MRTQPLALQASARPLTTVSVTSGSSGRWPGSRGRTERRGALHGDVVDAVVDQVGADGVVHAELEGDLELGAHAVGGADQDGVLPALQVEPEERAEAADAAQHIAVKGLLRQVLDALLGAVAAGDVHAGVGVGHGGVIGNAYRLAPKPSKKDTHVRNGVWKCGGCREQFTVTVGTIFEDSHIPLSKWLLAYHLLCASKKGMSAHQLHRMLKVTYRSAWFMAHRIRYTMTQEPLSSKLDWHY